MFCYKCQQVESLSAPWDWGWKFGLIMHTSHRNVLYLWKHIQKNLSWKFPHMGHLIFCESFVPFEYQLMHSIVFQFVAKIIGLLVLFERLKFSVREADLHSTPKWNFIKCIYETPWQFRVCAMVLSWPLRTNGLLILIG